MCRAESIIVSSPDGCCVLTFPEVHGCVARQGARLRPRRGDVDRRLAPRFEQSQVAGREGVRPAQGRMAIYWAVQSPIPGSSWSLA